MNSKPIQLKRKKLISAIITPKKVRPQDNSAFKLDNIDYNAIRNVVYDDFFIVFKNNHTIKSVKKKLLNLIGIDIQEYTLKIILKDMGFQFMKTDCNRTLLAERPDVRIKRIEYIKKIQALRSAGSNIVYIMEGSYVQFSDARASSSDNHQNMAKPLIERRIVILHAGNEKGFISGALMLGICSDSVGDSNIQISTEQYHTWLCHQLIPNLPTNSVLVIENAPHNTQVLEKAPSFFSSTEMKAWLIQKEIHFDVTATMPELDEIIQVNKNRLTEYTVDKMLRDKGHSVIRLPPFHPDLNPGNKIWSQINNYVAENTVAMNEITLRNILQEKIKTIKQDEWKNVRDQAVMSELKYQQVEIQVDNYINSFSVNGYNSESESECLVYAIVDSDSDI